MSDFVVNKIAPVVIKIISKTVRADRPADGVQRCTPLATARHLAQGPQRRTEFVDRIWTRNQNPEIETVVCHPLKLMFALGGPAAGIAKNLINDFGCYIRVKRQPLLHFDAIFLWIGPGCIGIAARNTEFSRPGLDDVFLSECGIGFWLRRARRQKLRRL